MATKSTRALATKMPRRPDYERAEEVRLRLAEGSLNLKGVARALLRLEDDLDGSDDTVLVRMLVHVVEGEAAAMDQGEVFLLGLSMCNPQTEAAA